MSKQTKQDESEKIKAVRDKVTDKGLIDSIDEKLKYVNKQPIKK